MMFFTGGATAAAKAALTATKFGKKVLDIVSKTSKLVKATQIGGKAAKVIKLAGKAFKAVDKARAWALNALLIPAKYALNMTRNGINKLRTLPDGVLNKLRNLLPHQKRDALLCNSPCQVDLGHVNRSVDLYSPGKIHSRIPAQNDAIKRALRKTNAKATKFSTEGSPIFRRLDSNGKPKSSWYYIDKKGAQQKIKKSEFDPSSVSRLPRKHGKWVGEPGNGEWFSDLQDVLDITKGKPVVFRNNRPDFSPWKKGDVKFRPGVLDGTDADFDKVYIKIMKQKGLKNKTAAKNLLREQGLTPHHKSNTLIELIPTKLHSNIPHVGSASDMRRGN